MRRSAISFLPAASALALLAALGGCGERPAPPDGPSDGSYVVRGEIRQLPGPNGREILIRHEAVPDLRDAKGKVVGMDSMTMPFALGTGVDRTALSVGERIEFTLEIRWESAEAATVSRIVPLPAGTRLAFDLPEAQPEEPPAAAGAEGADGDTPR